MNRNPVPETHANGSSEDDVDLESANQEGAHGPLMSVIDVLRVRPCGEGWTEESLDIITERNVIWGIETDPEAVTTVGGLVAAEDGEDKADEGGNQGGKN